MESDLKSLKNNERVYHGKLQREDKTLELMGIHFVRLQQDLRNS